MVGDYMNEILVDLIRSYNEKILSIEKEIFSIEESRWMSDYIDDAINDVKNIKNYMVCLSSILSFDDYVKLENLIALIDVHLRKNQNRICFDYDLAYDNIRKILVSKSMELKKSFSMIDSLRSLEKNYKSVLVDIEYNKAVSKKSYDFVLSTIDSLSNDKKINYLNALGFYSDDMTKNNNVDVLVNAINFNLERVQRFDTANNEKRKFIYSIVPNIFNVIKGNNFENISDTLCECFDCYSFDNNDMACFTSLLLELIYNEINDYRDIFLSDGFYVDKDSSNEIIKNCDNLRRAYEKVKCMYDGYTTVVEMGEQSELCFGYFYNQPEKARVIDDIKSYIDSNAIDSNQIKYAYNLLNGYLNKDPRVIFESLGGNNDSYGGYYKIKYHAKAMRPRFILNKCDGKFVIVGFFLKHDQMGNRDYRSMMSRSYCLNPDMDLKSTNMIFDLLESNMEKRK